MKYKTQAKRALRAVGLCRHRPAWVAGHRKHHLQRSARVDPYDRQIRHNAGTMSDMSKRYRTLDHIYAGAWSEVANLRRHGERTGVQPEPWDALVEPADAASARWYDAAARDVAIESWRARPQ
jgi:hypothetical protein